MPYLVLFEQISHKTQLLFEISDSTSSMHTCFGKKLKASVKNTSKILRKTQAFWLGIQTFPKSRQKRLWRCVLAILRMAIPIYVPTMPICVVSFLYMWVAALMDMLVVVNGFNLTFFLFFAAMTRQFPLNK